MSASPAPTAGRALPSQERLAAIRFLLTDVDGVLTDGRLMFDHEGRETKLFHVHDAAGLVYWHRAGGLSGFLSGRGSNVVKQRAQELGVHEVILDTIDKEPALERVLKAHGLQDHEIAYVGDDLLDLPVLRRAGLAVTVPEGRPEVVATAQYVTERSGGFGAVRDVVELLLKARGVWDDVVAKGGRP